MQQVAHGRSNDSRRTGFMNPPPPVTALPTPSLDPSLILRGLIPPSTLIRTPKGHRTPHAPASEPLRSRFQACSRALPCHPHVHLLGQGSRRTPGSGVDPIARSQWSQESWGMPRGKREWKRTRRRPTRKAEWDPPVPRSKRVKRA